MRPNEEIVYKTIHYLGKNKFDTNRLSMLKLESQTKQQHN